MFVDLQDESVMYTAKIWSIGLKSRIALDSNAGFVCVWRVVDNSRFLVFARTFDFSSSTGVASLEHKLPDALIIRQRYNLSQQKNSWQFGEVRSKSVRIVLAWYHDHSYLRYRFAKMIKDWFQAL